VQTCLALVYFENVRCEVATEPNGVWTEWRKAFNVSTDDVLALLDEKKRKRWNRT
jgi:hypothetical protein